MTVLLWACGLLVAIWVAGLLWNLLRYWLQQLNLWLADLLGR